MNEVVAASDAMNLVTDMVNLSSLIADRDAIIQKDAARINELCDDVFQLEDVLVKRDARIAQLNREATQSIVALQDAFKELQITRDVVAIRDSRIADLEAELEVVRAEIVFQAKDIARKHETIAGQLTRIEQLENTIQNKLVDISALEDTASDQTAVRRSVKFNVTHMLQSALAVLNGL